MWKEKQHAKASTLTELWGWIKAARVGSAKYPHLGKDGTKRYCSVPPRFYLQLLLLCFGLGFFFFGSITTGSLETSVTSKGRRREPEKLTVIADNACDPLKSLIDPVSAKMMRTMDTITQPCCSKAEVARC